MHKQTRIKLVDELLKKETRKLNKKYKTDKLSISIYLNQADFSRSMYLSPCSLVYDGEPVASVFHSISINNISSNSCKTLSRRARELIYKDLAPKWENTMEYKLSQMDLI